MDERDVHEIMAAVSRKFIPDQRSVGEAVEFVEELIDRLAGQLLALREESE